VRPRAASCRRGARVGIAAVAVLAAACAPLGPDFREPDSDWLRTWQPELYQPGDGDANDGLELADWWQQFEDPALPVLLEIARRENPGLRIAGLRILESRAVLGIASGSRLPQVQRIDAAARAVGVDDSGGLDPDRSTREGSLGLTVAWELDFWGRFRRAVEAADALYLASVTAQRDVQVLLTAEVVARFYAYKAALRRRDIARHNAALQHRSLEITERLFASGQTAELDLQQAKSQYLATRASIPGLEILVLQQRNALCALLGRPPAALPELTGVDGSLPQLQPQRIPALPAQLLQRRPDVRTAAWQAAAQSARIGIARADLFPALSLTGNLAWADNGGAQIRSNSTLSAGAALRWNIFNYGRLENAVRVEDARLQQALENYRQVVLQAARETDDAALQVLYTASRQADLDGSLAAAERALELATRRYQEGYSDFQRVLDAQRAVATQADRAVANHSDHLQAVVALHKALGGGWRVATTAEDLLPASVRTQMRERSDWDNLLDEAPADPGVHGAEQ
jgi:NodT family efflux transporter outer membrane factor (OMF) lipoprotein